MIKLTRTRTSAVIPAIYSGTDRERLNKGLLLAQKEIVKGNATKHEWNSDVWGQSRSNC